MLCHACGSGLLQLTVIHVVVALVKSTYIGAVRVRSAAIRDPRRPHHKTNDAKYRTSASISQPPFSNDEEIRRYLKWNGKELMIWKCRNAIVLPASTRYVDLYCQVIGTIRSVKWLHNGKVIQLKVGDILDDTARKATRRGRYRQRITPHIHRGTVYSLWIDFRLRMRRISSRDSGTYIFHVTSPTGSSAHRLIHVDLNGTENLAALKRIQKENF